MKSGIEILKIAVAVFLTVLLVSLSINVYHNSSDSVITGVNNMTDASSEWKETDINVLTSSEMTGAEVLNTIRKYKNSIAVEVKTARGASTVYTSGTPLLNEEGSKTYIEPTGLFACKTETSLNGVITKLIITEKAVTTEENVTSLEQAKQLLVESLHGIISLSDSWGSIAKKLAGEFDLEAKSGLAKALGAGYTSTSSWSDLAVGASVRISDLTSKLEQAEASGQEVKYVSGTLLSGEVLQLPFEPDTIILVGTNGGDVQVYSGGNWFVGGRQVSTGSTWVSVTSMTMQSVHTESVVYTVYRR